MKATLLALLCAAAFAALGDLRSNVYPAVGVMLLWGAGVWSLSRPTDRRPWVVFSIALAVRAFLVLSPASLSDDIYRYLWEGRAALLGHNPYVTPPASPEWAAVGEDLFRSLVNHPEVTSVYPPVALWGFGVLGAIWYDPIVVKGFMAVVDAGVAALLAAVLVGRGRSVDGAWLYALMPLAAVEAAGSGHLECAALACLVAAIWTWDRGRSGLGWAGLGALIKVFPVVLVPTLIRRSPWLIVLVAVLGAAATWPFADGGARLLDGLGTYAATWSFNGAVFSLVDWVAPELARPVCVAVGAVVAVWAAVRRRDPAEVALWIGGAFVLLSPTVHPWYVLWAWVPALICGVRAWTVLAALAPVAYVVLATLDPVSGRWTEEAWTRWLQYLPFLVALLVERWWTVTRPGPWVPGQPATRSRSPSLT